MTIAELQKEFLTSNDQHIAPEDFFILLAHVTNQEKTFLLAHPEYSLDTIVESACRNLFTRRLAHEPVAMIIGHKEFYGRTFLVNRHTLIPRPETECLVDLALQEISTLQMSRGTQSTILIADVGTGSGNIIISLATVPNFQGLSFHALDISLDAITQAQENARRHHVEHTITFHHGNLLTPLFPFLIPKHDIIVVANLPYLSEKIYQSTADDVKNFEPSTALVSGPIGLDHYFRLLQQLRPLRQSICVLLEISPEQCPLLTTYIHRHFPDATYTIHPDLAGMMRILKMHIHNKF
ncbi:MAG: peptide chain release factor N(5)-glutamine methyltransferase [Minisyncoccota bacterium]